MKETDIRKYAELMKELGLTGLEITEENSKVRLERSVGTSVQETVYSVPEPTGTTQAPSEPKDYISVKSPIVGVFYAAPAENADSYVSIGDTVTKGQTLCIVEAMKMMSEVAAPCDCEILQILKSNGDLAAYGETLFRYRAC